MNTDKLKRIRAKCVELLAMAEKRTQGGWANRYNRAEVHNQYDHTVARAIPRGSEYSNAYQVFCDGDFIASCAGTAEAGWKATIAAIDAFNDIAAWRDGDVVSGHFDEPASAQQARDVLKAIEAAWPEELL